MKLWPSTARPSYCRCRGSATAALPFQLIRLVSNGETLMKHQAAQKLAELALTHEHRVGIAKLDGIQVLLPILKSESEHDGLKAHAASALWNLAFLDANKNEIARAIPVVVELLRSDNEELKSVTAGLLSELAIDFETHQAIVDAGGIPTLADNMKQGSTATKGYATRALWRLAANEANRRAIRKAEYLATVFALLEATSDDRKISCIGLLRELARSETIDMTKYKHHKGLVELIRSGTRVQKELAVIALRDLTHNNWPNQAVVIAAQAVETLVVLVQDVGFSQRGAAAEVIGNLARVDVSSWHRVVIDLANCEQALVMLLRDGDTDQQLAACFALGNLAKLHHYNQFEIKRTGGVKLLLKLLSCENRRLQCAVVCALQHQQYDVDEMGGVIAPLVELLSGDIAVFTAVAKIFKRPSLYSQYGEEIARVGGVDRLVAQLENETESVRLGALSMLQNLSCGEGAVRICDRIRLLNGVPSLVKLVASGTEEQRSIGLKILRTMAFSDYAAGDNSAAIVQAGGIPVLVRALTKETLVAHAVSVLDILSSNPANVDSIVEMNAIPLLVARVKHKTEAVATAAIWILRRLGNTNEHKAVIERAGGYKAIDEIYEARLEADHRAAEHEYYGIGGCG